VGYGAEMFMHGSAGNAPSLSFYATSYAIQGSRVMEGGLVFVLICIAGNIINVTMEEGVFRGLFMRLAEEKYSFARACILSSALFGFWHIMQPLRNVLDGEQSPGGAFMMGLMLVGTSALAGVQYVMLYKATGSLWAGMAAHFINNASANLLHVVTAAGAADELMTVRITIASTVSFVIVLIFFLLHLRYRRIESNRNEAYE
jgi:membrane protease YdiL (CAAX protease family)